MDSGKTTINIRAKRSTLDEIDRAAQMLEISRSQFIREASIRRAISVINNFQPIHIAPTPTKD